MSESTTVREPLVGHTTQQAHGVSPHGCQATPDMSTPRRAKSPTMKLVQQTERYCNDPYALLSDLGRKHNRLTKRATLNFEPCTFSAPFKGKKHYHFERLVYFQLLFWCDLLQQPSWGKSFIELTVHTNLFICRIVRLPVVTLLITTEAGKEHSACSRRREMSILYIWKSFKMKLEEQISKEKYMHTEHKCVN